MSSKSIYSAPNCSCIICQKEFSSKAFHTHFQRIHLKTQTNYKNQTANAVAARTKQMKDAKLVAEYNYQQNQSHCQQCSISLPFEKRNNKFCSSGCSAKFTNVRKDYSKIKPGPKRGSKYKLRTKNYSPFTRIKQCEVCSKIHPGSGKSCSKQCKSKLLSIAINKRIDNGWNPQENRCRSKPSFLERSFKEWLLKNNILSFVKNKTFRCGKKIYYGDFFFPDKNLLIELDGKQHKLNIEYDNIRDALILKYHNVKTLRISYSEYMAGTKILLVESLIK